MSESLADKVKQDSVKMGAKKSRKVLTPDEVIEQQDKIMKQARIKKSEAKKKKAVILLDEMAKKFNVKVEEIDLNFIQKLFLGDVVKSSSNQVDEKTLLVGKNVTKFFSSDYSVKDISERVKLGLDIILILERETNHQFTESMLPKLENFFTRQNTNGHWLNKALGLE